MNEWPFVWVSYDLYVIISVEIFSRPGPFPRREGFGGIYSMLPGWILQGIARSYGGGV